MRPFLQFLGLFLVAAGISGTIDHLAAQPFLGVVLNVFNRFVIPRVGALEGYEVFANLSIAVLGGVLISAAWARGR